MQHMNLFWQKHEIEEFNDNIENNKKILAGLEVKNAVLNKVLSDQEKIKAELIRFENEKNEFKLQLEKQKNENKNKIKNKRTEIQNQYKNETVAKFENLLKNRQIQSLTFGELIRQSQEAEDSEKKQIMEYQIKLNQQIFQLEENIKSLNKKISDLQNKIIVPVKLQNIEKEESDTRLSINELKSKIKHREGLQCLFPKANELSEKSKVSNEEEIITNATKRNDFM